MVNFVVAVDDHDPYFVKLLSRPNDRTVEETLEDYNQTQADRVRPYLRSILSFKSRRHARLLACNPSPIYDRYDAGEIPKASNPRRAFEVRKSDWLMGFVLKPHGAFEIPRIEVMQIRREGAAYPTDLARRFRDGRGPTAWVIHCADTNPQEKLDGHRGWIALLEQQFKRKV